MNIHHIGFEVENLQQAVEFFEKQCQMNIINTLKWNSEQIVFLRSKSGMVIELTEGHNFDTHIAYENINLTDWIKHTKNSIDGPYQVLDGETVFVHNHQHPWYEICSFKI
ncbi:VOC family protein [Tenuibacillus multivorans]|uniref:VOC domain-containing protein n=1 Tax=Tenuibacillus multivorans TaxID=237069 RepID=A0A1H0B6C8_9BACI|nr:VOC family protein [Tenuibacillus multivorans]GEL78623.1 hypothetical protein TMU01_28580 [Tenuibacillus multivorans]SDN41278.1 hypothetical protein SAMN05216498_2241 [Tenuibacillus multivorans]